MAVAGDRLRGMGEHRSAGRLVGWSAGRLVGWSAGRLAGWPAGRLVGWSAGGLDGWRAGLAVWTGNGDGFWLGGGSDGDRAVRKVGVAVRLNWAGSDSGDFGGLGVRSFRGVRLARRAGAGSSLTRAGSRSREFWRNPCGGHTVHICQTRCQENQRSGRWDRVPAY